MIVVAPENTQLMESMPLPVTAVEELPPPGSAEDEDAPTGEQSEDVFVFPATVAQRRLWLMDQLVPGGNPALNMPFAARLAGRLDTGALVRSFNEIVARHEVLRTTFHCEKGQLRQIISPELTLRIPVVNVDDFPAAERARVPEHLMVEEAAQPFDLARGPAVRARLLRLAPEEHLLLITIHHAVSDGWSNGVLLRELGALYTAFVRGQASPLPEPPIQFADFAQWQQDQATAEEAGAQLAYWREVLAGELPVLDLPADRPRRTVRGRAAAGGVRRELLPAALVQSLKALAVGEGVSAYMLYLAAFTIVLGRYSGGQEDILLNTPYANRDRSEVESLIGLFLNPLLLRVDLTGDPTFRGLLGRVRRVALGAFEHGGAPFEKLVEELPPRRLQANFLYQSSFLQPTRLPGLELTPVDTSSGTSITEWSAAVVDHGEQTKFSVEYNAELYDPATIERMMAGYQRLLEAVAAPGGLDTPISQLPVEPAASEASVDVLLGKRWRLTAESVRWTERCLTAGAGGDGELGRVRAGMELLVLGRHLEPAPPGVVGEIYVRGLTPTGAGALPAAATVEHHRYGRLLKTGDLGRRREAGRAEWLGRADQAGRVEGLRVDTGKIEAALNAHPHVRGAVVLWRERGDGSWDRRLTAFFQGDGAPAAVFSHAQLRDFLRETLPEEWIPAAFVPVEHFPLTADGRLDAAALPEASTQSSAHAEERYDAPYLTIHHLLIEIWREVLHVESVGIRDDFFALGGNSLLAMRMLYRVEQACGKALLPATLFQEATVEHLAGEVLRQSDGETAPEVIPICVTGTRTPIFYLHGDMTGGGYYCMKLSRRLGSEQPFYALPPLNGVEARDHPSIEAMAAEHLRMVRAVQPHGPYVIGGFCVGGLIAYELARQLEAQGERVERLLIIDATAKDRRLEVFRRMATRLGRWRRWNADRQLYHFCRWHFLAARLERWTGLGRREQQAIFKRRLTAGWAKLRKRLSPPEPVETLPATKSVVETGAWFDPRWDVPLLFLWAVGGYRPRPYAGKTTLLLSHDLAGRAHGSPERVWKKFAPDLEARELVGSHLACITEHVDGLAETIRACLEESTDGHRT